jgi:hypothetical protein
MIIVNSKPMGRNELKKRILLIHPDPAPKIAILFSVTLSEKRGISASLYKIMLASM